METLVLDASYRPIDKVHWTRAFTLIFLEKVEVIEEYDKVVHSSSDAWQVPSVIRFVTYKKNRKRAIKFSRENVYIRDKGKCQYCLFKIKRQEFTYDHVIPRAQGGKTKWSNVVTACYSCNQKKSDRTPEQARMQLATEPVKPKSLPNVLSFNFVWRDGMPETWQSYLYELKDWNSSSSFL